MNDKLVESAKKFAMHRKLYDEYTRILKDNNTAWDACELELVAAMVEEGVTSVALEGMGNFVLRRDNMTSVAADNKPRVFEYLRESGNGALLKEDVTPQTLKAWIKSHISELADGYRQQGLPEIEKSYEQQAIEFLGNKGITFFRKTSITQLGANK